MRRPLRPLAVAAVAALTLVGAGAACGGDDASPGPEDLEGGLEIDETVAVTDFAFDPDEVTVDAGQTVEWRNDGDVMHAVAADDDLFDSGTLEPGESSAFTFDTPGRHEYHCSVHPDRMKGVVVVEED